MNAPTKTEDAFHQLIHRNHMWGLWEIASLALPLIVGLLGVVEILKVLLDRGASGRNVSALQSHRPGHRVLGLGDALLARGLLLVGVVLLDLVVACLLLGESAGF